jgi:Niemann-Pick C1 protein
MEVKKNCAYNGDAKPLTNSTGLAILNRWCPHLVNNNPDVLTCCDSEQVRKTVKNIIFFIIIQSHLILFSISTSIQLDNLNKGVLIASNFLARCPSCMTSFVQHICDMTCRVNNSEFVKVVDTKINPQTNKTYIDGIDFHISSKYTKGTYDSCKNVFIPSTGQKALDLMCGHWGSSLCDDEKWFTFMGDKNTPNVPFQINYKFHNSTEPINNIKPLIASVVPCNESFVSPTRHNFLWNFISDFVYRVKNQLVRV